MAQQVTVKIQLEDGKELNHISSISIEQSLFKHHSFEIVVPFEELESEEAQFFEKSHTDVVGKSVAISFENLYKFESDQSGFDFIFKGIITEISLRNEGDMSNVFLIKGYSPTIQLEDSCVKRTFFNQSASDIFNKVLSEYPGNTLRKSVKTRSKGPIKYMVQYNETNYQFLSRLAADYGEWFFYDGTKVIVGEPPSSSVVDFVVDGAQSFDISIALAPAKYKVSAYDYEKDKVYSGASGSIPGLNQFGEFAVAQSESLFSTPSVLVSHKPVHDPSEVKQYADQRKAIAASNMVTFKGNGEIPDITVGRTIKVTGSNIQKGGRSSDHDFGTYMVTGVVHSIDSSGCYSNSFTAVPGSVKYPPPNPYVIHPVGMTEPATVVNNADPDKLGRVKVKFYWTSPRGTEDEISSDWIRVGSFYSGNDDGKGMFFTPEIGAQVMVDYEMNHPENPFIVTSLYPKKSGTRAMKTKNEEKVFYTSAGNQIVLTDTAKENKIVITNANKQDTVITIDFKDNGKISIKTNGTIELDAKEDITLKATKKIQMEAMDVEIKASNGATLKASQVKIEADATAEIKANTSAKLESALTEVSASGIMTVKGSIVKIN